MSSPPSPLKRRAFSVTLKVGESNLNEISDGHQLRRQRGDALSDSRHSLDGMSLPPSLIHQ
ncbi:hypothetical protein HAX54_004773, partial [Datura stramonium]|nr:hypothetical protein [Datura stramonium]